MAVPGGRWHKKKIHERRHGCMHKMEPVRRYVKRHLWRKGRRNAEGNIIVDNGDVWR